MHDPLPPDVRAELERLERCYECGSLGLCEHKRAERADKWKGPDEYVRDFMAALADPKTGLRTDRYEVASVWATTTWGSEAKAAILEALRKTTAYGQQAALAAAKKLIAEQEAEIERLRAGQCHH